MVTLAVARLVSSSNVEEEMEEDLMGEHGGEEVLIKVGF